MEKLAATARRRSRSVFPPRATSRMPPDAMFAGTFPELDRLNIMQLSSPQSAIASAVIFNALIIVALIPLALRGVRFRAESAASVLRRNLLIYGVGGLIVPFIGIKAIDLLIGNGLGL